jgi:hypothetical protein
VNEVISSRENAAVFTAVRDLSTSIPLAGKKFIEYRIGEDTGTVYCRIYMSKSEVDTYVMDRLAVLSQESSAPVGVDPSAVEPSHSKAAPTDYASTARCYTHRQWMRIAALFWG